MPKRTLRLVQQSFTRWRPSPQEKEKMCVKVISRDGLGQSLLSEVMPDEEDAKRVRSEQSYMGTKSHILIRHLNIGICSILKNGMDI